MRQLFMICIFVLLCTAACNSAMRNGAQTRALKSGMQNTLTLSNGEVVYDLNGKWDITTQVGTVSTLNGVVNIKQEGNQFVGNLESGNFPMTESQKIKGQLKGNDIKEIKFNTIHGWVNSLGEIANSGKTLEIITESPSEGFDIFSTLKKR